MRKLLLSAALLACGMGAAQAADLHEAWLVARQQHPDMAAAAATRAAGEARRVQASRLWNPSVTAQAAAGAMGSQTSAQGAAFSMPGTPQTSGVGFDTSVRSGPGTRWGVEARMPLYNPERSAQGRQLLLSADLAELQAASVQQQLMLRTAQQYFSAVLAQQQRALLLRQQEATDQALKEAQDRFALGDSPITDVREAEARAQANAALVQAADVEMQIARQALAQTTGWNPAQLPPLHLPASSGNETTALRDGKPLAPLSHWLDLAAQDNLQVRTQAQALALAEQEATKAARFASTKVDLVAQTGGDHLSGSGRWGSASNSARQYMVGVQIQVPLYTGGQLDARHQELLRLQDKAQADLDSARLAVAQQVRTSWLHLQAGAARTQALESALRSAQVRLQATQLGRQVGDRTTLDLLQAHNDAMQSQSNLLGHQTHMAQERLQLMALAGQLDEAALQAATDTAHMLAPPTP
ncbi:TolC family protein [Acidovorax facilis]|uniref:TolC family protein n=1 Tax=Acidovorax facilis TaxID=12917 RepID=UPI003CF74118